MSVVLGQPIPDFSVASTTGEMLNSATQKVDVLYCIFILKMQRQAAH